MVVLLAMRCSSLLSYRPRQREGDDEHGHATLPGTLLQTLPNQNYLGRDSDARRLAPTGNPPEDDGRLDVEEASDGDGRTERTDQHTNEHDNDVRPDHFPGRQVHGTEDVARRCTAGVIDDEIQDVDQRGGQG